MLHTGQEFYNQVEDYYLIVKDFRNKSKGLHVYLHAYKDVTDFTFTSEICMLHSTILENIEKNILILINKENETNNT